MLKINDIDEDRFLTYDLETDHQYAPYATISKIGVKYGFNGKAIVVETPEELKRFKKALRNPDVLKVGFNNWNFDNKVLGNCYNANLLGEKHFRVEEENCHDCYLMFKAIAPMLPSYGLKFIVWWFTGDPHWPEYELHKFQQKTQLDWKHIPKFRLDPYLAHDLQQHQTAFEIAWEIVQKPKHWEAFLLDLSYGVFGVEMALDGGLLIDTKLCAKKIALLQKEKNQFEDSAYLMSEGQVENPNSSKQVGAYLDSEGFALELSSN